MRKSILGILLILLALLILFQALFVPALIDGWTLLGLSFTAIWFLGSLLSAAFTSSFLGLAFFLIILNSQWHFLNLPNATICLIAFLVGLGLDILFRGRKAWRFRWRSQINNSYSYQPHTSHTVHIRDDNFISDGAEVSFGQKIVYLDEAVILGDIASFEVNVSFANMVLYIPRDWSLVSKVSTSLGAVTLPSQHSQGNKTLELTGRVAFGSLEVIYL